MFIITLLTTGTLLAYAVPGFLFTKAKVFREEYLVGLTRLLVYLCSPCMVLYSFQKATKTIQDGSVVKAELLMNVGIFSLFLIAAMAVFILLGYGLFHKYYENSDYRIYTIAFICSNCGFFGVPLLEATMPDHPEALIYSSAFSVLMNIFFWTVGCFLISGDKRYISLRGIFLNPVTIATYIGLPLLIAEVVLPDVLYTMVALVGQFSTPLCMIILGIRLATSDFRQVFLRPVQYLPVLFKNFIVPLMVFGCLMLLPLNLVLKQAIFLLFLTPAATMVLSFAELQGKSQKTASHVVLISTILTIVSIPTISLLLPLLH